MTSQQMAAHRPIQRYYSANFYSAFGVARWSSGYGVGLATRRLRVRFPAATLLSNNLSQVVHTYESSDNCLVLGRDLATPLATGCGPLTNSSASKFSPLSPLQTQFGPLCTAPLPLGS